MLQPPDFQAKPGVALSSDRSVPFGVWVLDKSRESAWKGLPIRIADRGMDRCAQGTSTDRAGGT